MADLDLLVQEKDLLDAEQALIAGGLTSSRDRTNTRLLRECGYHLSPYVAPYGGAVELHREPLPPTVPFRLSAADIWRHSRVIYWRGRELRVPSPEHLVIHTAIHYGYWHTRGTALRRLWDLALITSRLPLQPEHLRSEARRTGAVRCVHSALWEVEALQKRTSQTWTALCRHLAETDELWCPRPPAGRLRTRARMLDYTGQRLALLWHTLLPSRAETANVTGCTSRMEHLCHFLQPRRLWRHCRHAQLGSTRHR
jgi:hypothetical protein